MAEYQNKLFSILGDSISTLDGYSVPDGTAFYVGEKKFLSNVFTPEDTWWGKVIARLGGELLVNNSISGSTVCAHPAYEVPFYGCSDERTAALGRGDCTPDVVMVFLGVNDWGHGFHIAPNEDLGGGSYAFASAYTEMLKKLQKNYPQAEIWCFTLPVSTWSGHAYFEFPYCYNGRHIKEYCEAIRTCAEACGCRVIDLYASDTPHDTIDGFHPTANGMQVLADTVLRCLERPHGAE